MEFLLKNNIDNAYNTYIILGLIFLLTVIKLLYKTQFSEFFGLLKNGKYLIIFNKPTHKFNFFNFLFYLFFSINLSLFLFLACSKTSNNFFFKCSVFNFFILSNIFILSKYFVEKLFFSLLNLSVLYRHLSFERATYLNFTGLFLFFINTILLYTKSNFNPNNILILSGFLVLTYLISLLILILNNQKTFLNHWFYFILYLCAFEISPVLIGAFLIAK